MQTIGFFFFIGQLFIFYISSSSLASTTRRLTSPKLTDLQLEDFNLKVNPNLNFENPRLMKAYCALQEWKKAMYSDPQNMTGNWVGTDVCSYEGVFCAHALDDPNIVTVALIDLNYGDIAGYLVPHLALLSDLGVFHINSNRFFGIIPKTFSKLNLLFEFDISNNRFVGPFPKIVLSMPHLRFLDLRYNEFEGKLPPELFDKRLDAIVLNNNRFHSNIPDNIGNSRVSMLVLANNKFTGCIPKSFVNMPRLEQVSLSNNQLTGCIPEDIVNLQGLIVLDMSDNEFVGSLPKNLHTLKRVERFDFSNNELTGEINKSVCSMPSLLDFRISSNYFNEISEECDKLMSEQLISVKDYDNCFFKRPHQKPTKICSPMVNSKVDCKNVPCTLQKSDVEPGNRKITPHKPKPPLPKAALIPPKTKTPGAIRPQFLLMIVEVEIRYGVS
ncbi:hypothetical protein LXL04_001661 [Taraxacum kok-saghyz]